jgi:hypothetical protein
MALSNWGSMAKQVITHLQPVHWTTQAFVDIAKNDRRTFSENQSPSFTIPLNPLATA